MKTKWLRLVSVALCLGAANGLSAQGPAAGDEGDQLAEGPTLDQLRGARDALIGAADYQAALDPAERIVTELERRSEQDITDDIMRLALVQAELRDFETSELNYLKVIGLLKDSNGEFSPTLIQPHQALGHAYIAERRFLEAIAVLEEAQHISQRTDGLFNVEQTELIDDITLAHLGLGDTVEARELQIQRLDNAVRRFGADDPRVIPFHTALGEYYDRSRLRISAKEQFEQALTIGEARLGESDPSVLGSLRRVAEIDLVLGHESEARDRLQGLMDQAAGLDPVEAGLSLAVLGDWAIVEESVGLARDYYLRAHRALEAGDRAGSATAFSTPRMLNFVPPLTPVDRATRSRPWTWGSIELEFDVSAAGRPENVRTVAVRPATGIASDYVQRIRETRFRPRLVAGQPVATNKVRFRHSFRYYVRE